MRLWVISILCLTCTFGAVVAKKLKGKKSHRCHPLKKNVVSLNLKLKSCKKKCLINPLCKGLQYKKRKCWILKYEPKLKKIKSKATYCAKVIDDSRSPTKNPTLTPTPSIFKGPFITAEHSSEVVSIPSPPIPNSNPKKNCPHLESGLKEWHDPETWGGSSSPTSGDITLPKNSKILVSQTVPQTLGKITIPATSQLIFGENISGIAMDATGFQVAGSLVVGSDTCRLETPVTITLHGNRPTDIVTSPKPPSFKGISVTGIIHLHGKRYYRTWTRLAKDALPGENFLFLQHSVNWKQGQDVVLVTTAMKDSRDWHQNEQLTVASVGPGPKGVPTVVYLTSPVQKLHVANSNYQAEVGLLSRSITIQGAAGDSEPSDPDPGTCTGRWIFGDYGRPCEDKELTGFGGHIIVYKGGKGYVEGVELLRMGQTNVLGRYPMHFHILQNKCEDCYFKDSSVHRSYYRCVSIHGTHNVTVSENVAYDVTGYCYYLEDGVEEKNTISHNLAAFIHMLGTPAHGNGQTVPVVYQNANLTLPADVTAAGYYITNLRNNIIGNAASGGWAGFAFPVLHAPVGAHKASNMRPANRISLSIDGNTAHSTGWWWNHAGAFYFGGSLYYENNILVYNAGRDTSRARSPCLVDKCSIGNCGAWCQEHERAWNQVTNSKTYLAPSAGLNSWSGRMEVHKFEAHDVGLGLEALESGFWIDKMLVVCRTKQILAMPSNAKANYISGNGFFWYDTGQEHIITNSTFRYCGQRNGYDDYDQSPTRGCNDSAENGCTTKSTVFGFLSHSDQFTPELMQGTRKIKFEECGCRFKLVDFNTDNAVPTVSGRNQNWLDVDGSVSGLGESTLIGSGLSAAGNWWDVDSEVVYDRHGPLKFIKKSNGPARNLGHIRIEWDQAIHETVGHSSCGNGNGADCPALGYISHFGPLFNESLGLPVTAQSEIVGPTGGFGWLLSLKEGAPKKLVIKQVEVDPSTPLILGISYPVDTSFSIIATAGWCNPSSSYSCQESFKEVNSLTEVRFSAGNAYYFDKAIGLLYLRVIMPPKGFTGDTLFTQFPAWHHWNYDTPGEWGNGWAIDRFSRDGVVLPKKTNESYLTIEASCTVKGDSAYCEKEPPRVGPDVCSPGYEQMAYDKCCMKSFPTQCHFSPTFAPTVSPSPTTSQPTKAKGSNLVTNPGFETGMSTPWFPFGSTTVTIDSSVTRTGVYSVLISDRTASWKGVAQDVLLLLNPGKTYKISGWAKLKNSSNEFFKLTLLVEDDNGTSWLGVSKNISNSWTYVSGSVTLIVVGKLRKAILYAEGPPPNIEFYVDDISLSENI